MNIKKLHNNRYLNKGKKSILVSASSDEAKRKIPNFDLNCKYFLLQREKK